MQVMFTTENIFYIVLIFLFLTILIVLMKLLSKKKSEREGKLLEKIERMKSKNLKLEESLVQVQQDMKKLDAASKTSFISDQLAKLKLMEEEVEKYKKRVEEAKNLAKEAMNMKYEFLSNIRHEIRTPMKSILAFADMLVHDLKDMTQISYANNILNSGQKLLELMDDILELSRLESGAFDIHKNAIEVRPLFQTAVDEFQSLAISKELELTLDIDDSLPDSLIVDDEKVQDIIFNLIDNAIKFTSSGYVNVSVVKDKYNTINNTVDISISVKDSGKGIEPSDLQAIFEMFEKRKDSDELELHGSGLGLSIHRKMARMMDGDIVVESRYEKGSTFIFTLRNIEVVLLSANETIDDSSIDFTFIKPEGGTIMIIDEDNESKEIIEDSFMDSALEVVFFNNPRDAIASLKVKSFDIIFIDVDMLSIDENAVSKVIAKMTQAPVVTLTAGTLSEIVFVKGGANIVGHLRKPISKLELFKMALKVLNSSHLIEEKKQERIKQDEFAGIDEKMLKSFKQAHHKTILALYHKAETTNDLGAIKIFAKELYKLSSQYGITSLSYFATELLKKIELFDIESINSMMGEYKLKVKRIQNL